MVEKLEKIFNPFSLLFINIAIFIATEFSGGGLLFYEKGIIHVIALLFVALAFSRIFLHYYTYDQILEKFIHATLAALLIFAGSHIAEFLSIIIFHEYHDSTFLHVINLYIISMIFITIGAEAFIRRRARQSPLMIYLLGAAILLLLGLSAFVFFDKASVSLEPDSPLPILYFALASGSAFLGLLKIWRIRKLVSIMRGFSNYLLASLSLIFIATLPNIFYEFFVDRLSIPEYQLVYASHFTFYAALSIMFLAFGQLAHLGGVYTDIKKFKK